ncbi:MAG: hypothetical protein HY002_13895 [Candidatus Rokubacteria bacterium]|nr:hypothetical protein [Candidatus Rokubacteria bacterium]
MREWRLGTLLGLFALIVALQLATPRLDSDQAVTGLMGVHILRGEFPIFFWGQDHAGVPESYGAAVTFFLLGISRLALSLVPAVTALALVLALYRTAAVLFGRGAALLTILFASIVSPYVVAHYVLARAYYIEHLLVGQIVLWGAALVLARPLGEAAQSRVLIVMGLAGGLGLYFGFQIIDALLPAGLALLLADPRIFFRRGAWLGLGGFLLGSLPFWIYNLSHDWATFATGVRFQGRESALEAARTLVLDLLPVILGVQEYVGTPPDLPWPFSLAAPIVVGAAVLLLAVRVARGCPRLRRDPALAGEAMLLVAVTVTVGMVWYGRFLAVPRYLVPLAPPLALVLARACQLVWHRARILAVAAAGAYLVAVGVGLVGDITILSRAKWAAYRAERADDEALLGFLKDHGLRRAYSYDYWVAPRLTFDAREDVIVAEPFDDRYPPHTKAVDAAPRPAYVLRADVERLEIWLRGIRSRAEQARVGPYTVVWAFAPPPPVAAVPRAEWTVRTSPGAGLARSLIDGQLESGWSSAPGPPGSAWVEVDLGHVQAVSGVTMVTDHPRHIPQELAVEVADGPAPRPSAGRFQTGGFTVTWRNGAIRTRPGRTLTLRFPPVQARRLRFTELAPAGAWAVAELFVLAPAAGPLPVPTAVQEGERLEAAGAVGPALLRYRDAIRAAPDDPEGYAEFTRLGGEVGLLSQWPAERAARHARLGLSGEARGIYARLARALGSDLIYAELAQQRARLAAAAGDTAEAQRLQSEADAVAAPRHRMDAVFGRAVELLGYDAVPARARPGESIEVVYHWRLLAPLRRPLTAYVHFRSDHLVFADDHELPGLLRGLEGSPQDVMERRRVLVPPETPTGTYRIVAGVWDPATGRRARRWWAGLVPTLSQTADLGTIEVLPR